MKSLAFAFFYFSEISVFRGLRAIQATFFLLQISLAARPPKRGSDPANKKP
jgi:hypothetical protein